MVTGGLGFIGSHLVDRLIGEGYSPVIVDNLSGMRSSDRIYIPKGSQFVYGDVSNFDFMSKIVSENRVEAIFHIAANADVPYSNDFPTVDFQSNATGIFNMLNIAVRNNIEKFIFSSTAAVYGDPKYVPMDENHPLCPVSNYGVTKLYGEKLGMAYFQTYGLDFSVLRIFNTYGPRQPRYVLYDLIKKLSNDKDKLEVLGDGTQIRDYSYIDNTIDAFVKVFHSPKSKGEAYNIAGGKPISISQLVSKISDALSISPQIVYTGRSWKGDIKNLTSDISKIKTELDYKPVKSFDEGLNQTVKWFRENDFKGRL